MLRTLVLAPLVGLALGAPAVAAGQEAPRAAVGSEVHADDGTVIAHVTSVTRDQAGRITSIAAPGLEPPDASSMRGPMVAQNDAGYAPVRVIDMRARNRDRVQQTGARAHVRLR